MIGGFEQVEEFANEIGMGVPSKHARLLAYLDAVRGKKLHGGWRTARVAKIEQLGSQQTYCLTEPMTHTVCVGGIATGQCRCQIVTLMPSYGFVRGAVSYVAPGHDELARQRG